MATRDEGEDFHEVRRAALVLRDRDPSEAAKILRQVARRGGPAAALAHGALAEILLDDFDDLDGAVHHFQSLITLAPEVPAGAIGLGRALARQGLEARAAQAFRSAIEGLTRAIRAAKASAGRSDEDRLEAVDESVLGLLEVAVEYAELDAAVRGPLDSFNDCLDWAEEVDLFTDEEDAEAGADDWGRYLDLRSTLVGLDGKLDELVPLLARFEQRGLPARAIAHARSLALEAAGDALAAAEAASTALATVPLLECAPVEVLRCADLLRAASRIDEGRALLVAYRTAVGPAGDEAAAIMSEIDARLGREAPPSLVRLGLRRPT